MLWNVFYTNTLSPTPHFIHDLMTIAFFHTYYFTFSQHSNVQVLFSPPFFFPRFFTWPDQVDTFYWLNGVLPRCIHGCPIADHVEWLQNLLSTKVCWIPLCLPCFCGLNILNNLLITFLLVAKVFAQLNLFVYYCNFYIIIIKKIKIYIYIYKYNVVNFILFNEYK